MFSGCMAAAVKELSSGEIGFQGLTAATVFVLPVNLYLFCTFENPLGAKAFSNLRSAVFASLTKVLVVEQRIGYVVANSESTVLGVETTRQPGFIFHSNCPLPTTDL